MKGLFLEYPFTIIIALVIVLVSISLILMIIKPEIVPKQEVEIDVRYACSQYDNSRIKFENFKTILYGFIKGQCNNFSAVLEEGISIDDIKRAAKEIDEKIQIVEIDSCKLQETNTKTIYICCKNFFGSGEKINITRREIKISDILICG